MNKQTHHTHQLNAFSLLPLKMILLAAEKDSPPRAPKRQPDANEKLASKLIAGMKKQFHVSRPFAATRLMDKTIRRDAVPSTYLSTHVRVEGSQTKQLSN